MNQTYLSISKDFYDCEHSEAGPISNKVDHHHHHHHHDFAHIEILLKFPYNDEIIAYCHENEHCMVVLNNRLEKLILKSKFEKWNLKGKLMNQDEFNKIKKIDLKMVNLNDEFDENTCSIDFKVGIYFVKANVN